MGYAKTLTKAQWEWLLDRHLEGYYIRDLADFVGVDDRTVARYWAYHGLRVTGVQDSLPPLRTRTKEFLKLGEEENA